MNATTGNVIGIRFMRLGLLALAAGMLFGVIGGFQFLFPEFLQELLFTKTRPLHVSLVIAWIFLAAIGGIYFYLPRRCDLSLSWPSAATLHYWVFLVTGLVILACYVGGRFGGREYLEYPAVLSIPIFLSWIIFGLNYFRTVQKSREPWPVYFWMWGTGIVFFLITFTEAYLWLIPFFRDSMVREIIVQWKSYGALTGSWNMLVYGTAIFVASRISENPGVARSKLAYSLYFLGLFNLMFGWAHHTYLVPSATWIRTFAYAVSMTELLILGKILWDWRASLEEYQVHRYCNAYRFLFAADMWIFVNLILALIISVPAFNLVTHGTHITVAHAMGSTIGINTMILLASVFYVIREELPKSVHAGCSRYVAIGYRTTNISLAVFFAALVVAGLGKGFYDGESFQEMMQSIRPALLVFAVSGIALMVGLWVVIWHAFRLLGLVLSPEPVVGQASLQRDSA
ncbi:MAG: cbb3-type cytochrome c oxidase subunit I [Gammaproteobacteria bacterium]|nr:cbb3-type cytochrome c oxidase subunit I [Gammaproteobacteria bacterium]MDH4316362.1 cbb3-type cytochrome c oxidase subunit I [Gammaproteobacteria bacterium]MDH5215470.1 cbb3-type cytochrome c oxidase subunit I [Gammaproteobacteria bacterium]MDH5500531.1 cbb3-type cytochrome c oxidase subunit I [Gammaproteobacteria bacterium]